MKRTTLALHREVRSSSITVKPEAAIRRRIVSGLFWEKCC